MNREKAKVLLPIIQAFSEGKQIQWLKPDSDEWIDVVGGDNVDFEDLAESNVAYRIKSEPKYRPFANAQECLEEMKKHQPFGWVKDKYSFYPIERVGTNFGKKYIRNYGIWNTPEKMFEDVTFLDGTPFGVKN